MKNVVELNGWVVIWDLDGCQFLTVYDTEREAREFGENPKRQGVTLFIGLAADLVARFVASDDMDLDDVVNLLNERKHNSISEWETETVFGEQIVRCKNVWYTLTAFEAKAIAREYQRAGEGGTTATETTSGMRAADLANLSRWITQAAGRESDDGNRRLLTDAGLELLRAAWAVKAFRDTIEEVRKVAVLIQETSSPNSIIATDVRARLQSIERDLMNFVQVDVD